MRIAVESWAPEYGGSVNGGPDAVERDAEPGVEMPPADWRPLPPGTEQARTVRFVDGVRRIDARVWVTPTNGGPTRQGIAASFAAGITVCDGTARIETAEVRRGLFTPAAETPLIRTRHCDYRPYSAAGDDTEELVAGLQQRMRDLEAVVAAASPAADLLVVDGPLPKVALPASAVGYVKSHQNRYLPEELGPVVDALGEGERTPLFVIPAWRRYSWYLRLPLPGPPDHPWAGIVRCEVSGDIPAAEACRLADLTGATLPAYASIAYKDPRAPQNLYPVAELERHLRRRLGDPQLLYRSLRTATQRPA